MEGRSKRKSKVGGGVWFLSHFGVRETKYSFCPSLSPFFTCFTLFLFLGGELTRGGDMLQKGEGIKPPLFSSLYGEGEGGGLSHIKRASTLR